MRRRDGPVVSAYVFHYHWEGRGADSPKGQMGSRVGNPARIA